MALPPDWTLDPARGDGAQTTLPLVLPSTDLRARLARRVEAVLEGRTAGVVRVSVPVERPVDPLGWLAAQTAPTRGVWSSRGADELVAYAGAADVVEADVPDAAPRFPLLEDAEDALARYYGGLRFDPSQTPSDVWKPFGTYHFVLPRFELRQDAEGQQTLTCTLVLPRDRRHPRAVRRALRALRPPRPLDATVSRFPVSRRDTPEVPGWTHNVRTALAAFRKGDLDKVVLARRARFGFDETPEALTLLRLLMDAAPRCYHLAHQPAPGAAFVAATPERLVRVRDGVVETEAVAGTRQRVDGAQADAALRSDLMTSEKDLREHAFVRDAIAETLGRFCDEVAFAEAPDELLLARGRHLRTGLRARLRDDADPMALALALHPTPAVGGTPTPEAVAAIAEMEGFDRGWYAGPMGWVGRDALHLAVGIRSGLVTPDAVTLYSGAGIVEGSEPSAEWDEIEHKLDDFLAVLGLEQREAA